MDRLIDLIVMLFVMPFFMLVDLLADLKDRILYSPAWDWVVSQSIRAWRWLKPRWRGVAFWAAGISIALVLLLRIAYDWDRTTEIASRAWDIWKLNRDHISPLATFATAIGAAVVATTALMRHFAQTAADRQRRITESFSKAVEQLGSDKLEVRLGGIYSLERVSKEGPYDYWTVMENLTAFVRERTQRAEAERTSQGFEQRVANRAYFFGRRPAGQKGVRKSSGLKQLSWKSSAPLHPRI